MPWQVKVRGVAFNTDDLTLAEAERIEDYTGESWLYLNPLRTAKHCRAVMIEALARLGVSREDALKETERLSLNDAVEAVTRIDSDLPETYTDGMPDPKAEVEPSTAGSSGADASSAGPPTSPDVSPSET